MTRRKLNILFCGCKLSQILSFLQTVPDFVIFVVVVVVVVVAAAADVGDIVIVLVAAADVVVLRIFALFIVINWIHWFVFVCMLVLFYFYFCFCFVRDGAPTIRSLPLLAVL